LNDDTPVGPQLWRPVRRASLFPAIL